MSRAAGLLAVTLRRGLAGKKGTDKATAQVLGLSRTGSTVLVPNTSTNRGQVNKASTCPLLLSSDGRSLLRVSHTRCSPPSRTCALTAEAPGGRGAERGPRREADQAGCQGFVAPPHCGAPLEHDTLAGHGNPRLVPAVRQ